MIMFSGTPEGRGWQAASYVWPFTITTMKLTDKIYNRESFTPFYTFEFFPPRTEQVSCLCLMQTLVLIATGGMIGF
jgi:hypothetical protein